MSLSENVVSGDAMVEFIILPLVSGIANIGNEISELELFRMKMVRPNFSR